MVPKTCISRGLQPFPTRVQVPLRTPANPLETRGFLVSESYSAKDRSHAVHPS
nr:MAG TPA: hypothetical protein [Caudoviricetes sp.]